MEPEIFQGKYYEVETTQGTWIVPLSVCGRVTSNAQLRDYVEGEPLSRCLESGWLCRLSMPGYLDCTEWSAFPTEKECEEYLAETYGEEFEESEE